MQYKLVGMRNTQQTLGTPSFFQAIEHLKQYEHVFSESDCKSYNIPNSINDSCNDVFLTAEDNQDNIDNEFVNVMLPNSDLMLRIMMK